MLDPRFIREHPDAVRTALENRGARVPLEELLAADARRRGLLQEVEERKARRNRASEMVAGAKRRGEDATAAIGESRELGEEIKTMIPYEQFVQRVEPIWEGMRRIGNSLGVHTVIQKSMRVSTHEMAAICALPDTTEQVGKKIESFLLGAFKNAAEAGAHIRERLSDFRYPIEVEAVVKLYDRLERARQPAFVPAGGWN